MANSLGFDKASDFKSIQCVCTSSVLNVVRTKAKLNKPYKCKG